MSRPPIAKKNIFWRAAVLDVATDGRMCTIFLAFIFLYAKPTFAVDEKVISLVKEGHFRIKCEKMVSTKCDF